MKQQKFAKKSLGQNFLTSSGVRDKILEIAGDISGKNVLEIGPGLGFLTTKLLASECNLTAIELDERAIKILENDFGQRRNFHLIHGSILNEDLDELFGNKEYSVIANIPYHITSPILRRLLAETINKPTSAILMVQKEVAKKICNTKKRSILSISVEIFAQAENMFTVLRDNFQPVPRVDSAVIRLQIRKKPLVSSKLEKDFFTVVNAGFSEKRKKLGNVLGKFFGIPSEKLLGTIDPNLRAEVLEIEDWKEITKNFQTYVK